MYMEFPQGLIYIQQWTLTFWASIFGLSTAIAASSKFAFEDNTVDRTNIASVASKLLSW